MAGGEEAAVAGFAGHEWYGRYAQSCGHPSHRFGAFCASWSTSGITIDGACLRESDREAGACGGAVETARSIGSARLLGTDGMVTLTRLELDCPMPPWNTTITDVSHKIWICLLL